ncbi:MAG: M48 family metalloprotease [Candidatus Lokiarchaeota archaeon]|nr:M48 family metalloprotease [Candidatus Lokiarchaeota archaeon]
MKKAQRFVLFYSYILISISIFLSFFLIIFPDSIQVLIDWTFWATIILFMFTVQEFHRFAKDGKRSDLSDIVAIFFFFFVILFLSKDMMTSIMGAFSIYLWFGIYELKDYPVLNKILIISLVTYNIIFIAGIISTYLSNPFFLNTTFAFSFWIILGLGFILFGRKYIIVWRFMSPEYLTLFLYIIAWLAVAFIDQYTPFKFIRYGPLNLINFNLLEFFLNIYFILILVNWLVYFISGPILDKMLGIKRVKNDTLVSLVNDVKERMEIKGKVKVGFGKYPILNAMAYGSIFDKRIAIIAEDYNEIPEDEMKGIIAHELAHSKGKHTLILTLITSLDLVIRMILGIPATIYDYTFGNPSIPLLGFILLNLGIYIILYIFVRYLEGKADLKSKKIGYTKELAKALYNLESFYATGREIGLNTMLLCDEKINKDNQLLNYMETAQYLHNSMIRPSRSSLLGNILNSHPPSYFRLAALLDDKLKPMKEAILPFLCLRKKTRKKYTEKFRIADNEFKKLANQKFMELFEISSVSTYLSGLKRKELFKYEIGNDYMYKNKITNEIIVGKLEDVEFVDDICDPDRYIVIEQESNQRKSLESSQFTEKRIIFNGTYFMDKNSPLKLQELKINEDKKNGVVNFLDKENNLISKEIKEKKEIGKLKLPLSVDIINDFYNSVIFFKERGVLKITKCTSITPAMKLDDFSLEFQDIESTLKNDYKLTELIIKPKNVYLIISKTKSFRMSEFKILKWLKQNEIRTLISLKKPVNNVEIGYLLDIKLGEVNDESIPINKENDNEEFLLIRNIFKKEVKIPYKTIDYLSFECNTGTVSKKSETSLINKFGYKIMKKLKPDKIFYLNKV